MPRKTLEKYTVMPQKVKEMMERFPNISISRLASNLDTTIGTLEKLQSEGKIEQLPKKLTPGKQRQIWGTKKDTLYWS
jgi:hypothetical protein